MDDFAPKGAPDDVRALEARALLGDKTAWNLLIQRFDPLVQSALRGRGLGPDKAKDLAQETWVRLMGAQRRGTLKMLRLPALALTQAAFLLLQDVRERAPEDSRVVTLEFGDPAPSAEERLAARQELEKAQQVIASFSPRLREVFQKVYSNPDVPHAQVAEQVGLSVQRVRQILWEIRGAVRAALRSKDE